MQVVWSSRGILSPKASKTATTPPKYLNVEYRYGNSYVPGAWGTITETTKSEILSLSYLSLR